MTVPSPTPQRPGPGAPAAGPRGAAQRAVDAAAYRAELARLHREPWRCVRCGQCSVQLQPGAAGTCPSQPGCGHVLTQDIDPARFPHLTARRGA